MKQYASVGIFGLLAIGLTIELPAIFEALVNFFAAGMIPGTRLTVGPTVMFMAAVVILTILAATSIISKLSFTSHSDVETKKSSPKPTLPKHRYQHI